LAASAGFGSEEALSTIREIVSDLELPGKPVNLTQKQVEFLGRKTEQEHP